MFRPGYIQFKNVALLLQKYPLDIFNALSQSQPRKMLKFPHIPHNPLPPHISDCIFFCFLGRPRDIWMGGLASYKNSYGAFLRWIWSLTIFINSYS